jgi:hypothetical protein
MFRSCVSLLVLFGFTANQWAAIPHAHAGSQPTGHDATPHIHLHTHSHGGHTHSHRQHRPVGSSIEGTDNHDADAIYLPTLTPPTVRGGDGWLALEFVTAMVPNSVAANSIGTGVGQSNLGPIPLEMCAPNCALYLTLRALRI